MNKALLSLTVASLGVLPIAAFADCGIDATGEVNVVTNFFPVLELLDKQMQECATDSLKIANKLTTDHRTELKNIAESSTSPFDAAQVANASITPLQARGQLMPLNDLVAKYRDEYAIEDQMLITFGDQVMAVAFMANAEHLFYRQDIFDQLGLSAPKTWDDVLAAAEKIKEANLVEYPFGAAYKTGWELGNIFIDIYLAQGGELFDPATGEPAFENDAAVATLELMKRLGEHMSPNALAIDFGGVKQQMQQGQVAMAFFWGDLTPSMDDPKESKVVDKVAFAMAPSVEAGGPPSTAFWWDGFVIPTNLDGDPDLTFRVIMEALKSEVVAENNDATLWLRSNYTPNRYSQAIIDSVEAGAPPYPMLPQSGLALAALGENIDDFLAGKESAEQSLADAAAEYRKTATDAGFLN